jgi:methionyl-tRNA formyltransferase
VRLIFAGTPEFAAIALQALLDAGHDIALVLTQPDRPAGRGMKLKPSPVKELALARGLTVAQPLTLKDPTEQDKLRAIQAEAMIVAAYGLILPKAVLDIPPRGCLNIHASLLPRWRGAAPIQRAMLAGDRETGITIMQMDAGLDTGAMLLKKTTPIRDDDTAQTLHDRLAQIGGEAIVEALAAPRTGEAQDDALACYAAKLTKEEAQIEWTQSSAEIARAVRAYNPVPIAFAQWQGQPLKIFAAQAEAGSGAPGTVLRADAAGIVVACGEGALRITELQRPGGKRLNAAQFLAGNGLGLGERLG